MQTLPSELQIGAAQAQGDRKEQQDYFAATDFFNKDTSEQEPDTGFLTVLADGMGGHVGSGNASVIAVNTFVKRYQAEITKNTNIQKALGYALTAANKAVYDANQKINADMGTTLVSCVIHNKQLNWVSVGDSSLYLYSKGKLSLINKRHSHGAEIQAKIDAGILTPAEGQLNPQQGNMLTSYLGLAEIPKIDFSEKHYQLELGNKILLCSDGLDNALTPAEIEDCLRHEISSQEKCDKLMAKALAKKRPNQDNITMVLLELEPQANITKTPSGITQFMSTETIEQSDDYQETSDFLQKKWLLPILLGLLIIFLILTGIFYMWKTTTPEETTTNLPITTSTINNRQNDITRVNQHPNPTKECNLLKLKEIQTVLQQHNFYPEPPDGKWGKKTKKAVQKYQKEKGIDSSNGLNAETCEALLVDYGRINSPIDVPPHHAGE